MFQRCVEDGVYVAVLRVVRFEVCCVDCEIPSLRGFFLFFLCEGMEV